MDSFSRLIPVIGKFLHNLIPSGLVIPILSGKLKGKKWMIGSSNFECVFGTYEYSKHIIFEQEILTNEIVYDIGAHVGFYTLLASELVGNGRVVSFEPFPQNFEYLRNHVEMNKCKNVIINNVAVSNFSGVSYFQEGEGTYTGYLSENGKILVETIKLDDYVNKNSNLIPNCLKIDVEGEEYAVLQGAKKIIENYHPKIFLATHNEIVHEKCIDFLNTNEYHLEFINNQKDEIYASKKVD